MNGTRSAGGIVIDQNDRVAMIKSRNSHSWLFPKGRVDPGETDEQTARREIFEEAGLKELVLIADLGEFTRPRHIREGRTFEQKTIRMFLFKTNQVDLSPSMEIEEAQWVPFDGVLAILGSPHKEWFTIDREWFESVRGRIERIVRSR